MTRQIRPIALGSLLALGVLLAAPLDAGADDTALFTARVTPNVLLMIDNSNSMNEIMEHPSYDRTLYPFSCNIINPQPAGSSGTVTDQDGRNTPWRCTTIGCFLEFDNSITGYTLTSSTSDDPETGYITRRFCGQTRKLYHDGGLTNIGGVSTNDNKTRWLEQYTEWYFSIDTASTTTYLPDTQTAADIVADVDDSANGRHFIDGTYFGLFQRSRITGAREIATDVIYQTNTDCPAYLGDCGVYEDNIRFGLATFQGSSHGGYVSVPVGQYTAAQRTLLANTIYALDPLTSTPLAETLFKLYTYFMHRTDSNMRPQGAINSSYRFPAYAYRTSDGANSTTVPADPVVQSCQKHFIIMITDGEPTEDDFSTSGSETLGFADFKTRLVGNLAPDGGTDIDTPEEGSPPWASNGTGYLDDLALYMQRDMRLDMTGTQNVDVYTIGFDTFGIASALLAKTAARGNGLFAESSQSDELTQALVDAISDIILKAQSFTAATVPASRTTSGDNLYSAFFVPVQNSAFWQGHLKDFDYTAAGDILTADGRCAVGTDEAATPPCPVVGSLRTEDTGFWDAADEMPTPANRKLYVELASTSLFAQPTTFTIPSPVSTAVTWLGLVTGDNTSAPYTSLSPNTTTDMAQALIRYLRGCTFSNSSTCTMRTDVTGTHPQYFGDIFHSNPVVVGSPNSAINEGSYKAFANTYRQRPRVIYAGANDGYVHGFHAGAWDTSLNPDGHNRGTGQELMGFMPYGVRTSVKNYVKFTSGLRTQVLVDGSPVVADVWFNRDTVGTPPTSLSSTVNPTLTTKHALQWRTVLIQSLRDGGQHYSALDITNPPAAASTSTTTYPRYLWAFPAESGGTAGESEWVGYTWSEPVITRVRVKADSTTDTGSYERWVAIFGGGYHPAGDPNGTGYKVWGDAGFTAKGRSIYMVDINTGKVLAKKHWENDLSAVVPSPDRPLPDPLSTATTEQTGIEEMRYAIASAPAVFDLDFDGFADVVYIGDLGGNLWKWVINKPGQDAANNLTHNKDMAQPDWPFRLFFRGSASTEPPAEFSGAWNSAVHYQSFFYPPTGALRQGKLILAFGAGERADPIGPASEYNDGCMPPDGDPNDADCDNNNHYYVVKDADPREVVGTPPNRLTGTIVEDCTGTCTGEGELANFDAPTPPTCAQMNASYVGYYITARDAEKFVTASTIFLGDVFTGSFFPADPSTTTICDSRGTSYLYRFDLECGVGGFPDNADTQEDRREPVGAGLPTRPRVSVGDLNQGDPCGCVNKIVVVTSDGEIWNDCPGSIPSSGVKVRSWRER